MPSISTIERPSRICSSANMPSVPISACFAISAKRTSFIAGGRVIALRSSKLGERIRRHHRTISQRNDGKAGARIWLWILMQHFAIQSRATPSAKPLTDFDVPLRRKFPITQPAIYKRLQAYNRPKSYDFKVKPFGVDLQSVVIAKVAGMPSVADSAVRSISLPSPPFTYGSISIPARPIRLDWIGSGMDGALEVTR